MIHTEFAKQPNSQIKNLSKVSRYMVAIIWGRKYKIINIPHDFFFIRQRVSLWVCPHTVAALNVKTTAGTPRDISGSKIMVLVLIADDRCTFKFLFGDPKASSSIIAIRVYYTSTRGRWGGRGEGGGSLRSQHSKGLPPLLLSIQSNFSYRH